MSNEMVKDIMPIRAAQLTRRIEISVSLRVTGMDLNPSDVTRAISTLPIAEAQAGQAMARGSLASTGTWFGNLSLYWYEPGAGGLEDLSWSAMTRVDLSAVPGIERVEMSMLLNGSEGVVMEFAAAHLNALAAWMSDAAIDAEVDLDIPTAGIEVLLDKGERIDANDLAKRLSLQDLPKP